MLCQCQKTEMPRIRVYSKEMYMLALQHVVVSYNVDYRYATTSYKEGI